MPAPSHQLLEVDGQQLILQQVPPKQIVDLRHRVLRTGLPRSEAIFPGDEHPTSLHVAALAPSNAAICCATFHQEPHNNTPAWRLRGMATDAAYRGKGVGSALLRFAEKILLTQSPPIRHLWCNARTPAVRFYQSLGWKIISEEFDIPTAGPHYVMTKTL